MEGAEVAEIGKTVAEHFPDIVQVVKGMHSYEVPAIIQLPVAGADAGFLAWLRAETESS